HAVGFSGCRQAWVKSFVRISEKAFSAIRGLRRRLWRRHKPASGSRTQGLTRQTESDLADQVQRRCQGGVAFFPLGRAHFTRVCSNVLGCFYLAQQFACVTADAASIHFDDLDLAIRVDDEGATL